VGVLHAKLEGLRYYAPFIDNSCVLRRYGTVEVSSSIEETIFGSERTICETTLDLAAVPVFARSWEWCAICTLASCAEQSCVGIGGRAAYTDSPAIYPRPKTFFASFDVASTTRTHRVPPGAASTGLALTLRYRLLNSPRTTAFARFPAVPDADHPIGCRVPRWRLLPS
jgi:hypothetical protein